MSHLNRMKHSPRRALTAAFALLCVASILGAFSSSADAAWGKKNKADAKGGDKSMTLKVDGQERRYLVHVPAGLDSQKPVPLVIALHGGSAGADSMIKGTKINEYADREKFIAVYPNALDKKWNSGFLWDEPQKGSAVKASNTQTPDDVRFISALIDRLTSEHKIDQRRIYATGISQGAKMSYRLACNLADRIAAVAAVAGSISVPSEACHPSRPVAIMEIHGTEDPLVPYNGGATHILAKKLGDVMPAEDAVKMFAQMNGCNDSPAVAGPIDRNPKDGTSVVRISYGGCRDGAAVELLKVEGGGHTWPGGTQYLPVKMVGRVTQEIDFGVIWEFFKEHPKSGPPA